MEFGKFLWFCCIYIPLVFSSHYLPPLFWKWYFRLSFRLLSPENCRVGSRLQHEEGKEHRVDELNTRPSPSTPRDQFCSLAPSSVPFRSRSPQGDWSLPASRSTYPDSFPASPRATPPPEWGSHSPSERHSLPTGVKDWDFTQLRLWLAALLLFPRGWQKTRLWGQRPWTLVTFHLHWGPILCSESLTPQTWTSTHYTGFHWKLQEAAPKMVWTIPASWYSWSYTISSLWVTCF